MHSDDEAQRTIRNMHLCSRNNNIVQWIFKFFWHHNSDANKCAYYFLLLALRCDCIFLILKQLFSRCRRHVHNWVNGQIQMRDIHLWKCTLKRSHRSRLCSLQIFFISSFCAFKKGREIPASFMHQFPYQIQTSC